MQNCMKWKCLFSILVFTSVNVNGQSVHKNPDATFKIVGYYFLNAAIQDSAHTDSTFLFLNKITHLNIAFFNPDSNGAFKLNLAIDTLIKRAHNKNVKVLASIAGGGPHPVYRSLLKDDKRELFINKLVQLVQHYNLDGIDVDIEGSDIDENYQNFVTELAGALRPLDKLITSAIATAYKDQLPDKALQQFDFVNVMSYDRTGPWRPDDPGNHSPYQMAVEDLDYWHNERLIPENKLVLGLPFYGYGFGPSGSQPVSMDYKSIVSLYPGNQSDTLHFPGNVTMYFNNLATIKQKTALAIKRASGVMIWQILGDAPGDKSLLNTINEVVNKKFRPH